jgi:hypothetical protein
MGDILSSHIFVSLASTIYKLEFKQTQQQIKLTNLKMKKIFVLFSLATMLGITAKAQTTIVQWSFENLPVLAPTPNPAPSLNNSEGSVSAACIGMELFGGGTVDYPDVLQGKTSDTGLNLITNITKTWRCRGNTGNGWTSTAPVGTQGAQFNVDTSGFTGINVGFDWYLTTQGEANLQLQYTTDGINWSNVPISIDPGDAGLANVDNTSGSDVNSVTGYYISDNLLNNSLGGQDWFTNLTATITDPNAANNSLFAIRLVNASTGASCISSQGTALNNSSGNWRFDNIAITGTQSLSQTPPAITASAVASVDGPFTNTFTDSPTWRSKISSVKVNGNVLVSGYTISAGKIVYTPSLNSALQTAGTASISILATNYSDDHVTQYIAPGAAKTLAVTAQPAAPTGNGGTLVLQPALAVLDQYNNVATNCTATFVATPSSGWTFGPNSGATQALSAGTVNFTNLSASSAAAVSGATIAFATSGPTTGLGGLSSSSANSAAFNIPALRTSGFAPGNLAVEQLDLVNNNSTFTMLEVSPTALNQTTPVNVYPVPATGTNALRQSKSGSTGRLTDSADGALLCFSAGLCGDSTVSDITTLNPRGAGTFDAFGNFVLNATYTGDGADSDQARSAVAVDNITYFMGDKGGIYTNNNTTANAYIPYNTTTYANVRSLKSFGGVVYALQQSGGTDPYSTVLAVVPAPNSGSQSLFPLEGFPVEPAVLDFYMLRTGHNGTNYDVVYYIDGTNTTSGAIYKYYFTGTIDGSTSQQIWAPAGGVANDPPTPPYNTPDGGDGLCAVANPNGGVDLYYTTGSGGSISNSVVHVHDSADWNQAINITTHETNYTATSASSLKGIAFAPVPIRLSGAGLTGGKLTLTATNDSGLSFSVHATNNLTAPRTTWPVIGITTENPVGTGQYKFTDSNSATNANMFYFLSHP